MIEPSWRRIAGFEVSRDGAIACVWLAHDKQTDMIHLYDACIFRREVPVVIAEGLNARGRWIPISWEAKAKDFADKLLDRGCNILPEPNKDSDTMSEVVSRDIWERMRTGRFKVDKRLKEWLDEFESFQRKDSKVPKNTHPVMAATRHAMAMLEYARRQATKKRREKTVARIAII